MTGVKRGRGRGNFGRARAREGESARSHALPLQISTGKVSQLRLLSTTNGTAGWDSLEKQSQQCVYSIGSPKLKGYIVPFH